MDSQRRYFPLSFRFYDVALSILVENGITPGTEVNSIEDVTGKLTTAYRHWLWFAWDWFHTRSRTLQLVLHSRNFSEASWLQGNAVA